MQASEYFKYIDHSNLKQDAPWADIRALCEEAGRYGCACVCVQPTYVKRIRETYPDLTIATVIGFPNGYVLSEIKVLESRLALAEGADELDMVINLTDVKNGDFDKIAAEISAVRQCVPQPFVLKVIIETCFLTEAEKIKLCEIVTRAKADYIKTSTGFGPAGATLVDIELFKAHIGPDVKIKAAGGIRTYADIQAYVAAGCARIGASAAVREIKQFVD